ncbi:uncharacterized protein EV420DRAFT_1139939 [Desarmillaria tabescens]|uniref:Uncharacterized protein n=1 Tax=Armillaria tabescens TaxID=1929756 RepID=A0AA39TT48_ARMTA|nr:uncharacterized protein EV420DRAFT_1139939 [Desarmillaria tabescens]KAK0462824.1 hypothetical protein EV420DRAFT_1139939 [Desarmillaria tabescens]
MTAILARALFSLLVEGYHDFIQATIRRLDSPLPLQRFDMATEQLSVYDEHTFMRHFRTIGVTVEHEMAVCHALLSFIGFETRRDERFDVDDKSRTIFYHIPNFPDLEFKLRVVMAIPSTEPITPNTMVTLQWRRPNGDWQPGGSWSFCFEDFFRTDVVLPSNFEEIEDSGFLNATLYAEFRDSMQVELLRPLWDRIQENFCGIDTGALRQSLELIEEAQMLMSKSQEDGMEKLRESVRVLPWESQF